MPIHNFSITKIGVELMNDNKYRGKKLMCFLDKFMLVPL